jgi:hypothetical protein
MPFTLGFRDNAALADHHQKHRSEFSWISQERYADQADKFLGGPLNPNTQLEGTRSNGETIRFDTVTNEFGILSSERRILSYFKPDPRDHGRASNLDYFQQECKK